MTITSVQNPRVKQAAKLRNARQRAKQRRILIDGARELGRAIEARVRLIELFVCESLCTSDECRRVLARVAELDARVIHVTDPVFEKLAFGQRAEGLLAVADTPPADLQRIALPPAPLVAVLEGVEKPGNLGAVLRTADAAGVSAVIVADGGTDLFNPNAIRASLGTIFTTPLAAAGTAETIAWLRRHKLTIHAARVDGSVLYTHTDLRRPAAILLGSESRGLGPAWTGSDVIPIRLPMLGAADSLNVSATAAVLFYEALRQRTGA